MASTTVFNLDFDAAEVRSWLTANAFVAETIEKICGDKLDGEDVGAVYSDEGEMRHYFPNFKERMRFKKLLKPVVEDNVACNNQLQEKGSSESSPDDLECPDELNRHLLGSEFYEDSTRSPEIPATISSSPDSQTDSPASAKTVPPHLTETPKSTKGWISRYQLPSRFSVSVEAALKSGSVSVNLQNEMIRDVCTGILNHSSHPSKAERVQIAKMIIKKYPCMADKKILDCSTEWGSLELKIMNRMKKLQKLKRVSSACASVQPEVLPTQNKRPKTVNTWEAKPPVPDGETLESLKSYSQQMRPQLLKKARDVRLHKEILDHTFPLRRREVLEDPRPVNDVLQRYPSLRQYIHLRSELCRILHDNELPAQLRQKFRVQWLPKVLKYAEGSTSLSKYVTSMDDALLEADCDMAEIKDRTTFLILNKALKQRNGKARGPQEEVFTVIPRNSPVDQGIEKFVQPQIVAVGTLYDFDQLYIVCEGTILCTIPQERMIDAVIALLSSFYTFNISYKEGKAILNFLEQALLGIGRGQTLVSVSTFFKAICAL